MKCQLCGSEVNLIVDPFAGLASLVCGCRTVQMSSMGVIDHGRPETVESAIAGVDSDPGGGSEVAGRDNSAAQPVGVEENAAADESEVTENG